MISIILLTSLFSKSEIINVCNIFFTIRKIIFAIKKTIFTIKKSTSIGHKNIKYELINIYYYTKKTNLDK